MILKSAINCRINRMRIKMKTKPEESREVTLVRENYQKSTHSQTMTEVKAPSTFPQQKPRNQKFHINKKNED